MVRHGNRNTARTQEGILVHENSIGRLAQDGVGRLFLPLSLVAVPYFHVFALDSGRSHEHWGTLHCKDPMNTVAWELWEDIWVFLRRQRCADCERRRCQWCTYWMIFFCSNPDEVRC